MSVLKNDFDIKTCVCVCVYVNIYISSYYNYLITTTITPANISPDTIGPRHNVEVCAMPAITLQFKKKVKIR